MPKLPDNLDDLFFRFRYVILIFLLGAILTGVGLFISQNERNGDGDRVEVLTGATEGQNEGSEIVVEIAGEVERPGVYKLPKNSRIEDLLVAAGGVSPNADRDWMEKSLNRAARLADGTKIYIPAVGEQQVVGEFAVHGLEAAVVEHDGGHRGDRAVDDLENDPFAHRRSMHEPLYLPGELVAYAHIDLPEISFRTDAPFSGASISSSLPRFFSQL